MEPLIEIPFKLNNRPAVIRVRGDAVTIIDPDGQPGGLPLVACFWENDGCVDAIGAGLTERTWAEVDGLIREALAADAARVASIVVTAEARLACAWGL